MSNTKHPTEKHFIELNAKFTRYKLAWDDHATHFHNYGSFDALYADQVLRSREELLICMFHPWGPHDHEPKSHVSDQPAGEEGEAP